MGFICIDDIRQVFAEVAPQIPDATIVDAFNEVDEVSCGLFLSCVLVSHINDMIVCRTRMEESPIEILSVCLDRNHLQADVS